MPAILKLDAQEVDESLDNGQLPDALAEWLENVIAACRDATDDHEILLVITNDFDHEDEEAETETKE